jgi:hypothetical protein
MKMTAAPSVPVTFSVEALVVDEASAFQRHMQEAGLARDGKPVGREAGDVEAAGRAGLQAEWPEAGDVFVGAGDAAASGDAFTDAPCGL